MKYIEQLIQALSGLSSSTLITVAALLLVGFSLYVVLEVIKLAARK